MEAYFGFQTRNKHANDSLQINVHGSFRLLRQLLLDIIVSYVNCLVLHLRRKVLKTMAQPVYSDLHETLGILET